MRGKGGGPIPHHVEPKLFLLPNDVLVLSSGREGCYLWTLPLAELTPVRRNDSANDSLDDSHSPEGYPARGLARDTRFSSHSTLLYSDALDNWKHDNRIGQNSNHSAWRSCVVVGEGG